MIVDGWRKDNKVRFLAVLSPKANAEFPDTPLLRSFAKTDTQRQIIDLLLAAQLWGRPFAMPPGVPDDRVALMRKAFDAMSSDESFLKEAAKSDLDIDVLSGVDMHRMLDEQYGLPADVVEQARKAITP